MEYHADRFVDNSFLIFKNDQLIAALPAHLDGVDLYSHQGLTYGGLLLSRKLKLINVLDIFKQLLQQLERQSIERLHIKQLPSFYSQLPSEELEYLLHLTKANCYRIDTASIIDYNERLNIQSNRLEGVKKAKRNGLRIIEEAKFDKFWNEILLPNLKQRHSAAPTHTLAEIQMLHQHFPKKIRQFNVYLDGEIVGGATLFETCTTAHVQYISAGKKKQELGTLDFLFEYLIEQVFTHKRYFNFGISNENGGTQLNKGLSYWKECFGARTAVHRQYTVDTKNHTLLNTVLL